MWKFSKKRFFITLGLSILIWYVSVLIQGVTGFRAPLNLPFSASICKVTGFPLAMCLFDNLVWVVNIANILFWFWATHLLWTWFKKGRNQS